MKCAQGRARRKMSLWNTFGKMASYVDFFQKMNFLFTNRRWWISVSGPGNEHWTSLRQPGVAALVNWTKSRGRQWHDQTQRRNFCCTNNSHNFRCTKKTEPQSKSTKKPPPTTHTFYISLLESRINQNFSKIMKEHEVMRARSSRLYEEKETKRLRQKSQKVKKWRKLACSKYDF